MVLLTGQVTMAVVHVKGTHRHFIDILTNLKSIDGKIRNDFESEVSVL